MTRSATEAHRHRQSWKFDPASAALRRWAAAFLWVGCGVTASVGQGPPAPPAEVSIAIRKVIGAAIEQTEYTRGYDARYVRIAYPGGDVPRDRGVCTDVLVRAFRATGVDLQKEVHEDMRANFAAYPQRWGLAVPDSNIDHRRVPNLMTFFRRKGKALPVTQDPANYKPGDIVAWDLGGGVLHIGIAVESPHPRGGGYIESSRVMLVHNIGAGAKQEDILFKWRIIGHYRYF